LREVGAHLADAHQELDGAHLFRHHERYLPGKYVWLLDQVREHEAGATARHLQVNDACMGVSAAGDMREGREDGVEEGLN
jgi:hypothetical protein